MLTWKQQNILAFVEAHPEMTQGQIAKAVRRSRESINKLLARARKRRNAEAAQSNRTRRRVVRMGDMAA